MKIQITKKYDGKYYVALCDNIPGCYVQTDDVNELDDYLRLAIDLYRKSCLSRNQEMPLENDHPVLPKKVMFNHYSSSQLAQILSHAGFHVEYEDTHFILMQNNNYPFGRVVFSQADFLSHLIIERIFGKKNIIYDNEEKMRYNVSAV